MGLGPAGADLLPEQSVRAMRGARQCFVRTTRHPAALAVLQMLEPEADVTSFDDLYDVSASFDDVYGAIVDRLAGAARAAGAASSGQGSGYVCYGVPGSPLVAERTVVLLRTRAELDVEVVLALSFLDLVWERLGVDPVASSVRIVDAASFAVDAAGQPGPFVVAQCHDRFVLSQVKLAVDDWAGSAGTDPPDAVVLHHLGLPDEQVLTVPWHEIDRQIEPDHLTALWVPPWSSTVAVESARMEELVRLLRERCPWDRRQTHASLAPHLLEETYEALEAIAEIAAAPGPDASELVVHSDGRDLREAEIAAELSSTHAVPGPDASELVVHSDGRDLREAEIAAELSSTHAAPGPDAVDHLLEELGDVVFQVYFHARLAAESGWFTMTDVLRAVHDKLVERHPHVFGGVTVSSADEVAAQWERSKQREKGRTSIFDGIPAALPALAVTAKVQRRAESLRGASASAGDAMELAATLAALASSAASLCCAASPVPTEPQVPSGAHASPVPTEPQVPSGAHASPVPTEPQVPSGAHASPVPTEPQVPSGAHASPVPTEASAEQLVGRLLFTAVDMARRLEVDAETALRSAADEFRRQVEQAR